MLPPEHYRAGVILKAAEDVLALSKEHIMVALGLYAYNYPPNTHLQPAKDLYTKVLVNHGFNVSKFPVNPQELQRALGDVLGSVVNGPSEVLTEALAELSRRIFIVGAEAGHAFIVLLQMHKLEPTKQNYEGIEIATEQLTASLESIGGTGFAKGEDGIAEVKQKNAQAIIGYLYEIRKLLGEVPSSIKVTHTATYVRVTNGSTWREASKIPDRQGNYRIQSGPGLGDVVPRISHDVVRVGMETFAEAEAWVNKLEEGAYL